jgi:DNA polymerase elongation subunit (family B)
LWIKTEDKKILRLADSYQPFFYILSKNEHDGTYLFHVLSQQDIVKKVGWEENKSTNLFEKYSKRKLICVHADSVQSYTVLLKKLEKDFRVKQTFNTDLSHLQQYLFHRLKVEPTSKVEIEYDDDSKLVKITKVKDEDDIPPPPFSILRINIHTLSGKVNPEDPIVMIRSRYEDAGNPEQAVDALFDSKEEKDILQDFCCYVQDKDPDILIFSGNHYANTTLDYLFARMLRLGLELDLGRDKTRAALLSSVKHPGRQWIGGRLAVSDRTANRYSSVLDRFAGLVELCRFGFLTIDLAAKYGMNRLIDSRNCYEMIQRDFVIPRRESSNKNHEHIRTIEELVSNDRGGMIISPQTGLHENVLVLDYDNEYANLIVNHNLSYETTIDNDSIKAREKNKGLLPSIVEKFLQRRLCFEGVLKRFSEESQEYLWCKQRMETLKIILVCLYGTTGSIWNRYRNVRVFEEINRLSREILIKTKDIVQRLGYELIYADTDSVFVKNPKRITSTDQYERVVNILRRETGLPISIEHDFKFLVLLPLEASEKIDALKQYYGVTHKGQLVVRGIESRRYDTPKLIKKFQVELLSTLFDYKDAKEIMEKGYENALLLVTKAMDRIMLGGEDIIQDDLAVSKLLGQNITKYRSLFPHVSAAIQLSNEGGHPSKGDTVKYIYTDSQHKNPLCRVTALDSTIEHKSGKLDYDREKYKEMLLDAADTVLGYFGFDRDLYGDKQNLTKRKWQWFQELRIERERDIKVEMSE